MSLRRLYTFTLPGVGLDNFLSRHEFFFSLQKYMLHIFWYTIACPRIFFFKKASQDLVSRKHLFYCFTPSLPLHNVFFCSFFLCRSFLGEISQPPHPFKNGSSLIPMYLMNSCLGHNKIHCFCISSHLLVLCTCHHQRYY